MSAPVEYWTHLSTEPPALGADLPAALDAVVQRALRKAPDDRYESAGAFARELQAAAHTGSRPRRRRARNADPDLGAFVTDAGAASRAIREAIKRSPLSHAALRRELDALAAAIRDGARGAERDADQLNRQPPSELRARLREELMRGDASSRKLVVSLKQRLIALQQAERRLDAFRLEMQRQLVELESVRGLIAAAAKGDLEFERQLAGRVARLREELITHVARDHASSGSVLSNS